MKIYNFKLIERKGNSQIDWTFKAKVTVEKGFWLFKTKEEKIIFRAYAEYWRYADTGKLTELCLVEEAVKVYEFNNGKIEKVVL
jgi:hypothetical protein